MESHAFIGYQKDTPAAVVFQASRQLKRLRKGQQWRISSLHENRILGDVNPEELMCENKGSNVWKIAVSIGHGKLNIVFIISKLVVNDWTYVQPLGSAAQSVFVASNSF